MFKKHHNFMLKKYKDLGRILGKEEQKKIKGGAGEGGGCEDRCQTNSECNPNGGNTFICAKDLIPGCGWNYKVCTIN
jgi:hypothetical protein